MSEAAKDWAKMADHFGQQKDSIPALPARVKHKPFGSLPSLDSRWQAGIGTSFMAQSSPPFWPSFKLPQG